MQRVFRYHGTDQNCPLKSANQRLCNYRVILLKPQLHGSIQSEPMRQQLVLLSLVSLADFMEKNTVY